MLGQRVVKLLSADREPRVEPTGQRVDPVAGLLQARVRHIFEGADFLVERAGDVRRVIAELADQRVAFVGDRVVDRREPAHHFG